ncbi:MAG TPA: hypothetical protein VGV38_09055 [Pyrinomonadaceae bacterium]|nr:hypothetical protein [Pyrinomonadaceae bacterium]
MKTPGLKTTATCLLLVVSLAAPAAVRAQSSNVLVAPETRAAQATDVGWDALKRLPPGERVRVELKNGRASKGALQSVDDQRLVVTRDGSRDEFARADVRRVHHLRRRAKKGLYAAIGAGAGAGVGLALAASKADSDIDDSEIYYLLAPIAAGVGAAIGALVGASRRQRVLVYESSDR